MSIAHGAGECYLIRVVCPNGDRVEADLPVYADQAVAVRRAGQVAYHLSPHRTGHGLGSPRPVADLFDTLSDLGFDAAVCSVEVVTPSDSGVHGWGSVRTVAVWDGTLLGGIGA